MAFLDFLKRATAAPSVESMSASAKSLAVEAAKPAAEIIGKGSQAQDIPTSANPTPMPTPSRGRSLGWER